MPSPLEDLPPTELSRVRYLWLIHTFSGVSPSFPSVTASVDVYGTDNPDRDFAESDAISHDVLTLEYDGLADVTPDGHEEVESLAERCGFEPDPSSWHQDMGGFEERLTVSWAGAAD